MRDIGRALVVCGLVVAVMGLLATSAWGSTTPTVRLDQSAGHAAGSTANLGLDLKFTNTGTDSPRHLAIDLPPGLLANASINGGACLKTADVSSSACQVGSGTVSATADPIPGVLNVPLPVSVPVTFHLVPPPAAGDLAGLVVEGLGQQLGSTGEIKIRPTGDPQGVGVRLDLVLPDQLPVTVPLVGTINAAQISLSEISSTFDGLRYPARCPSPAGVNVSADSYGDSTVHTVSAPLAVTGCSALSYSPSFRATVARDDGDRQATVTTEITQGATEAPSGSVALAFPSATLGANPGALNVICPTLSSSCIPVGSVRAVSPLYPAALSGTAYLTGSLGGLSLTLVFPSPFPLTLSGTVDLAKNSATFNGLPDIPLTSLAVSLSGGQQGLFTATCAPPSGTATATLTDQNDDRTVVVPSSFTVSGCPPGGGSGPAGGGGSGPGAPGPGAALGRMTLSGARWSGLRVGRPSLRFRVSVTGKAAKLASVAVALPAGLRFVRHRIGRRLRFRGVTLAGAHIKSLSLSGGHLVVALRRPVSALTVRIGPAAMHESAALKARARKLKTLGLTVIVRNATGQRTTIRQQVRIF